jgi:hypothetical protein
LKLDPKVTKSGKKWPEIAQKVVKNDQNCFKRVKSGQKWSESG